MQTATGFLYALPHSGWGELIQKDAKDRVVRGATQMFWFSSDVLLALAPYIGEKVTLELDEAQHRLFKKKDHAGSVFRLLSVKPEGPEHGFTDEGVKAFFEKIEPYEQPLCWDTNCGDTETGGTLRAAPGSAYCVNCAPRLVPNVVTPPEQKWLL